MTVTHRGNFVIQQNILESIHTVFWLWFVPHWTTHQRKKIWKSKLPGKLENPLDTPFPGKKIIEIIYWKNGPAKIHVIHDATIESRPNVLSYNCLHSLHCKRWLSFNYINKSSY